MSDPTLIVSGSPGSGRSHLARQVASTDALWLDAYTARSMPALLDLLPTHTAHDVVLEDLDPGLSPDAIAQARPDLCLIITTIGKHQGAREVAPLDLASARALWERTSTEPPDDTLLRTLRGHPQAIVTAARRAAWSTPKMRQEPWDTLLWGPESALQRSYERAWSALSATAQALLGACAVLGDALSPQTLWPWHPFAPELLETLHQTHWFERPWALEHGARHFLAHTTLDPQRRALARWVAAETISLATRFRVHGERGVQEAFASLWPLLERVLEGEHLEDIARGALLTHARILIVPRCGFAHYDALTTRALEVDVAPEDRLLLKAFHQVYLGDRGQRGSALAKLHDWAPDAEHLESSWRRASFFNVWGTLLTQSGNLQGLEILERAYEDAMACGDFASAKSQQLGLARMNIYAQRSERARAHAMAALSLAEHGDMGLHVHVCQGMYGAVLRDLGDLPAAAKYLRLAIDGLADALPAYGGVFLGNLSLTLMEAKRFEEAIPVLQESWALLKRTNHKFAAPKCPLQIAYCHYGLGQFAQARDWLDETHVALEALPLSTAHFEADALRVADAVRTGRDPTPWLDRCEGNPDGSPDLSHEAVRARAHGTPHTPQTLWEELLWREETPRACLDLENQTLRIGDTTHSFKRRLAAWRILMAMARSPAPLDAWTLVEHGWPGQPLDDDALRRLYVTIKRLRDLGLEPWLLTTDDGYLLTQDVTLEEPPS